MTITIDQIMREMNQAFGFGSFSYIYQGEKYTVVFCAGKPYCTLSA